MQTIEEFKFISVKETLHFEAFEADGILGLARQKEEDSETSHFLEALKEAGIIQKAVFALEINGIGQDSWIHFGGDYDRTGSFYKFDIIPEEDKWAIDLAFVKADGDNMFIGSEKAFLDSANPFTLMPHSDFSKVYSKIIEKTSCFEYAGLKDFTFCECGGKTEDFPQF